MRSGPRAAGGGYSQPRRKGQNRAGQKEKAPRIAPRRLSFDHGSIKT
jgi:hypothetical protein